ncbi:MAG: hypothetical protein Q7K57_44730 [Burkholderiaceae bacterium]|nr:hypothetical protein [Burkholderiaceae bacterium]
MFVEILNVGKHILDVLVVKAGDLFWFVEAIGIDVCKCRQYSPLQSAVDFQTGISLKMCFSPGPRARARFATDATSPITALNVKSGLFVCVLHRSLLGRKELIKVMRLLKGFIAFIPSRHYMTLVTGLGVTERATDDVKFPNLHVGPLSKAPV